MLEIWVLDLTTSYVYGKNYIVYTTARYSI